MILLSDCLQNLSQLMQMKLPSSTKCIASVVRRSFNAIAQIGMSTNEVVQACFKLLTVVLRDFKWFGFKESQIKVAVVFLGVDAHHARFC